LVISKLFSLYGGYRAGKGDRHRKITHWLTSVYFRLPFFVWGLRKELYYHVNCNQSVSVCLGNLPIISLIWCNGKLEK
jgi:hypothetical protein